MRPWSKNGKIRINDIKIGDNGLAIATNKGLFFHSEFENDTVPILLCPKETLDVPFNSVDIHPNQNIVIRASGNGYIYLFNPRKPENVEIYLGHLKSVEDVCFSTDGKYFVFGSTDNTAIIWKQNIENKSSMISLEGKNKAFMPLDTIRHAGDINDIAIADLREYFIIATTSSDKTVLLNKINKEAEKPLVEKIPSIIRHDYGVESICFGKNDTIIYSKRIPRGSAPGSKRKRLKNGWFFITL